MEKEHLGGVQAGRKCESRARFRQLQWADLFPFWTPRSQESVGHGTSPWALAEAYSDSVSWPFLFHRKPAVVTPRSVRVCKDVPPLTSKVPPEPPPGDCRVKWGTQAFRVLLPTGMAAKAHLGSVCHGVKLPQGGRSRAAACPHSGVLP